MYLLWNWNIWNRSPISVFIDVISLFSEHHLKPASFKRWICPSDSLLAGIWLFCIFLYVTLRPIHHSCPRDASSPHWETTSQWPYLALKDWDHWSARQNLTLPFVETQLKPASFKRWIFISDSFDLGFWLFWIFLCDLLTSLHQCARETSSPV